MGAATPARLSFSRARDAPIFRHSQFGLVEDCRKAVPLLCDKLAALGD